MALSNLNLENPAMQSYITYSAILALKLLILSPMTAITRVAKKAFNNADDAKWAGCKEYKAKTDETVERIRRAHRNDLENIPAFWFLAALYLTTGPSKTLANLLFLVFVVARVSHTILYAVIPMQPWRGISFFIAEVILFYMGLKVMLSNISGF